MDKPRNAGNHDAAVNMMEIFSYFLKTVLMKLFYFKAMTLY
jgi:hypothetical protein